MFARIAIASMVGAVVLSSHRLDAGPATAPAGLKDIATPLNFRPLAADQTALEVSGLYIHDITDSKGINITATTTPGKPVWYYRAIAIRNCLLERIGRSEAGMRQGLHTDFIRIAGGGDQQDQPTQVLIQDVTLRDGDSLPLLIQDGRFSSVTLRRVRIANTAVGVQLAAINTGRFDHVLIDECPGLRVALMGRPGSIGTCIVRNSPGAAVGDTLTKNGRSGARIVHQTPPAPATRPATPSTTAPSATAPAEDRDLVIGGRRYRVVELE